MPQSSGPTDRVWQPCSRHTGSCRNWSCPNCRSESRGGRILRSRDNCVAVVQKLEPESFPGAQNCERGQAAKGQSTVWPVARQCAACKGAGRCGCSCSRGGSGHSTRSSGKGCSPGGLRKRAWESAQERARTLTRGLLQVDSNSKIEGFEDDPILLVRVGHDGGPVPPMLEKELSSRIARLLAHDAQKLAEDRWNSAEQGRRSRNDEAFDTWVRNKDLEERYRVDPLVKPQPSDSRPSAEQCQVHYEAWCHQYDLQRSRSHSAGRVS